MKRKIVRIGNALGVTLPPNVLANYGLHLGETVEITPAAGHIEIAPIRTLAELFKSWEPIAPEVSLQEWTRIIREDRDSH